jgi:hypothetical protein
MELKLISKNNHTPDARALLAGKKSSRSHPDQCCSLFETGKIKKAKQPLRRKDKSNFNTFLNTQDNYGKII